MKPVATAVAAAALAAVAVPLVFGAADATARDGVKAGLLTCRVEGGAGFVVGSHKAVDCVFQHRQGGRKDRYSGRITKIGVDIGVTGESQIAWVVFAPGRVGRGALAGTYVGATGEATAGAGLGANVLVGGSDRSVALQPVSVQVQTGFNVAAGIASLELERRR